MNEIILNSNNTIKLDDGRELVVREYLGQRVLTFKSIDELHKKASGTTSSNYYRNRKYFIEGEDYFHFKGKTGYQSLLNGNYSNLADLDPDTKHFSFYLITESGYLMLTRSFRDDLAIEVQRRLINSYFKLKSCKTIYDAIRMIADDLENHTKMIESINKIQQLQQASIEDTTEEINTIKTKMETPIAEGALTPTQLAEKLEIYSKHNNPHAALIEDICQVCGLPVRCAVVRPETDYMQYRIETKNNVQIIQAYLKPLAQEMVAKWWEANKDTARIVEYYKKSSGTHVKGDPKIAYYKIYKTRRFVA